jgi:hypothetical protein
MTVTASHRLARLDPVSTRRLLLSPLLLLVALVTIFTGGTVSASAGHGPETRVRAIQTATADAVGQPSSETAGSVGCLRPSQPGLASGSCVATNTGGLADDMIVVRGGTSDVPGAGEVFSGSYGSTLDEAAAGVPHGQIRATTAGEIRAAGGTVDIAPELTRSGVLNEQHVSICLGPGSCPFGPLQPNPVPKGLRIS